MLDFVDPLYKQKLSTMGYSIIRKLDEGSFAKVYLATYKNPEKKEFSLDQQPVRLAVKIVDRDAFSEDFIYTLESEIHMLANISHPHIIHVHSMLKKGSIYMIFMRHAEYGNLCYFLNTYGPLKEKFARIWIRQLASALIYLHYLEVAHRSVKCENILVTSNNNVKLADFGFARFTEDRYGIPALCSTYCGTLPYAAPEVVCGSHPYDGKAADIWSLGIVLYVMLNKCFPFNYENLSDLWNDQMKQNFKFLKDIKRVVTPEAVIVTELLLQGNPRERLTLDNLLRSKWIAEDPSLVELSTTEKLAMKQAEKLKNTLQPGRIVTHEIDEEFLTEEDAIYRPVIQKDPCEIKDITLFNRGTNTYDTSLKGIAEYDIY